MICGHLGNICGEENYLQTFRVRICFSMICGPKVERNEQKLHAGRCARG